MGFAGDWVGPANIDVDSMIKQIEIAIAEGADGIITCGLNPEAMVNVMKQADEAGIPVVLVNAGSDMEAPYLLTSARMERLWGPWRQRKSWGDWEMRNRR